ncbi:TolC family protein [PVC group bacterium]|nr:TolC family protein [PVC group bacterium]
MKRFTCQKMLIIIMTGFMALVYIGDNVHAGVRGIHSRKNRSSSHKSVSENKMLIFSGSEYTDEPRSGARIYGGQNPVYIMSLKDAISMALKNNKPLEFAQKQIEISKMRILETWRNFFPTFSLSYNTSHGVSGGGRFEGASKEFNLSQTLYAGGRVWNSYRQARLNVELARLNLMQLKVSMVTNIKESFFNVALYEMNRDIQEDVLVEAKRIYDIEKKLLSLEINTQLDYLNAISGYNTIKFTATSAEKDLVLALIALKNALGLPLDSVVHIVYDMKLKKIEIHLDECLKLAITNRPDLKTEILNLEIAGLSKSITLAGERPTVSVDWNYQRKGESPSDWEHISMTEGYTWSIKADVPLWYGNTFRYSKQESAPAQVSTEFFGGAKTYQNAYTFEVLNNLGYYPEKEQSLLAEEQKAYEVEDLKRNIHLEVTQEYFNFMGILQQIETSLLKLDIAARELAINEVKRDLGEILVKELLDAQISLAQEKFSYIQLLSRYYLQLDKLSNVVGIPEYFTY